MLKLAAIAREIFKLMQLTHFNTFFQTPTLLPCTMPTAGEEMIEIIDFFKCWRLRAGVRKKLTNELP